MSLPMLPGPTEPPAVSRPAGIDLDALPKSLCEDGYRASLRRGGGDLELIAGIYAEGARIDETSIVRMADTDENLPLMLRLRALADAACRFFTTGADLDGDMLVHDVVKRISGLTRWRFSQLRYRESSRDCVDVLYNAAGEERAVRIVEDEFAEPLTPKEVDVWRQVVGLVGPDEDDDEGEDDASGGQDDG